MERVCRSQVGGNGRRARVVEVDLPRRWLSVQCCERLDDRLFASVQSRRAGALEVQTDHNLVFSRGPVLLQSLSPQILPLKLAANLVQIGLRSELDVNQGAAAKVDPIGEASFHHHRDESRQKQG